MTTATVPRVALNVAEAAEACGVTEKAIRRAINTGELKAKRQSRTADGDGAGKFLIPVTALAAWVEGLADA
jgi:hypothetical protein